MAAFLSVCLNFEALESYHIRPIIAFASTMIFIVLPLAVAWGRFVALFASRPVSRSPVVLTCAVLPSLVLLGTAFFAQKLPGEQPCVTDGITVSLDGEELLVTPEMQATLSSQPERNYFWLALRYPVHPRYSLDRAHKNNVVRFCRQTNGGRQVLETDGIGIDLPQSPLRMKVFCADAVEGPRRTYCAVPFPEVSPHLRAIHFDSRSYLRSIRGTATSDIEDLIFAQGRPNCMTSSSRERGKQIMCSYSDVITEKMAMTVWSRWVPLEAGVEDELEKSLRPVADWARKVFVTGRGPV